jgi:4-hydroxy-tetrahydrodipicolinate reductase
MVSDPAPVRIAIAGATGRMGEAVARLALAEPGVTVLGLLVRADDPALGTAPYAGGPALTSDLREVLRSGVVLIEFTAAEAVAALARAAAAAGAALVSGTTGLGPDAEAALDRAAAVVPVVHAPNMSRGVALLSDLAAEAARLLGEFDLEIEERHHRHKLDAPSGTALALARALTEARGVGVENIRHGRSGRGARPGQEIAVHALRGGDWVGEHTIFLAGPGETIELRHRAESRTAFAAGALAAARFAAAAPPGRYGIRDVLKAALPLR